MSQPKKTIATLHNLLTQHAQCVVCELTGTFGAHSSLVCLFTPIFLDSLVSSYKLLQGLHLQCDSHCAAAPPLSEWIICRLKLLVG